jgi:hypothetical protein
MPRIELATNLTGIARAESRGASSLFQPLKRPATANRFPGFGGIGGLGTFGGFGARDNLGLLGALEDIGRFNPLYCEPFLQKLMRRSVMPRIARILLASALTERQYIVAGAQNNAIEAFHQSWLNNLMPQILLRATNAVWFGWQPYALDWGLDADRRLVPTHAHDLGVFEAEALEDPYTRALTGIRYNGQDFDRSRSLVLTWEGDDNNHYGEGQAVSVYPYWWSWSVLLVLMMRYYERSVDPVRIAFARNISVPTGQIDDSGQPVMVDLTDLMAEVLDVAAGGDSVGVPMGDPGDGDPVRIETLEIPDRADTFLRALSYLEEKQFLGSLSLPGLGISSSVAQFDSGDSRTAEKMQLRILEHVTDMPLRSVNELIPVVHRMNNLPGPPPKAAGSAFKREQEETFRELFKASLDIVRPEIGPDGRPTGRYYRPGDIVRWGTTAASINLPTYEVAEVASLLEDLAPESPGKGGRPPDPLGPPDTLQGNTTRAEDRAKGLDR